MFEYRFIRLTGDLFCVRFSTGYFLHTLYILSRIFGQSFLFTQLCICFFLVKYFLNPFDFSHFHWVFSPALNLNLDAFSYGLNLKSEYSKTYQEKQCLCLGGRPLIEIYVFSNVYWTSLPSQSPAER